VGSPLLMISVQLKVAISGRLLKQLKQKLKLLELIMQKYNIHYLLNCNFTIIHFVQKTKRVCRHEIQILQSLNVLTHSIQTQKYDHTFA